MTDTIIDSKVQRIQAMLYAKASNEPEVQFKRLYKYLTNSEWIEIATDKVIRYHPDPAQQTHILKANGKKRPIGIATIKDRVVQQAVKMLIEPIYEAIFLPCSYGFLSNTARVFTTHGETA